MSTQLGMFDEPCPVCGSLEKCKCGDPPQPVIPPALLGRRARDEALARVEEHANAHWKHCALAAVRVLAYRAAEFTTDDVWAYLEDECDPPPEPTHEPRAMGAVMQNGARLGLIERTDRTRQSARPECHARDVRIWRTLPRRTP